MGRRVASTQASTSEPIIREGLTFTYASKTFKGAIETVSADLFIKAALPNIAMGMTARTSKVQLAFLELKVIIRP